MKHLYPTGDAFIPGWPTTEIDVTDKVAAELLAYFPPAYTTDPPPDPAPAEDPQE